MAPRRNRKSARPRRKVSRKRGGKRTTVNSLLGSSVRPDRLIVRLPYQDSFILQTSPSAPGTGVAQVMNMNSIYDPDRTGVGHQPLGYDQWSSFYAKYRVVKVAYNVTFTQFWDGSTNADYGAKVGIMLNNGVPSTTISDNSFWEQPHMRYGNVGTAVGMSSKTFKGVASCARVAGRLAFQYMTDDKYQANFGYNPNEYITLALCAAPQYSLQQTKVVVAVRLVYYVELFDPYQLKLSNTEPENRGPDPNEGTEKEPSGYKPTPSTISFATLLHRTS